MAARIPLVIGDDGTPQQLPDGDTLVFPGSDGPDAPDAPFTFEAENIDLPQVRAGAPVAVGPEGYGVVLASARDGGKPAVGLSKEALLSTHTGTIQTGGLFYQEDWTLVIGVPTLTPKTFYFLDGVIPGKMTKVAPTVPGKVNQLCGYAMDEHTIRLVFATPILL